MNVVIHYFCSVCVFLVFSTFRCRKYHYFWLSRPVPVTILGSCRLDLARQAKAERRRLVSSSKYWIDHHVTLWEATACLDHCLYKPARLAPLTNSIRVLALNGTPVATFVSCAETCWTRDLQLISQHHFTIALTMIERVSSSLISDTALYRQDDESSSSSHLLPPSFRLLGVGQCRQHPRCCNRRPQWAPSAKLVQLHQCNWLLMSSKFCLRELRQMHQSKGQG